MTTKVQALEAKTVIQVVGTNQSQTLLSASHGEAKIITVNTGFMGPKGPKGDPGSGTSEWLSEEW